MNPESHGSIQHSSQSTSGIESACFVKMQSRSLIRLTESYHQEEYFHIKNLLRVPLQPKEEHSPSGSPLEEKSPSDRSRVSKYDFLVAIGCGPFRYRTVAWSHSIGYVGIDPNVPAPSVARSYRGFDELRDSYRAKASRYCMLIPLRFEDLRTEDIPRGRRLFLFMFNLFPYLVDPEKQVRELVDRGDTVVVSSWNESSDQARRLRSLYYSHLVSGSDPRLFTKLNTGYLDRIITSLSAESARTERHKGLITDIVTISY